MIRAVCFDLDGTLIDATEGIVEALVHTFEIIGEAPPSREAIIAGIGIPLETHFQSLTERDPSECAAIYRARFKEIGPDKTTLFAKVRPSLDRLRAAGLKLGIVTSKRRDGATLLLGHLNILDRFEVIVGADDVAAPKPDPESLQRAMEALSVAADEMVFVGDTGYDVLAARNAGVTSMAVTTGYTAPEASRGVQPDPLFHGIHGVADFLLSSRGGIC